MTDHNMKKKPTHPVRFEEHVKPMLVAGLGKEYRFGAGIPLEAPAMWEEFATYSGNISGQKGKVAYGLCFDLENGKGIEYVCGVEVSDAKELPENFVQKKVPSFTYAVFEHEGHVSTLRETIDQIWMNWIPKSGYEKPENADFFFERYGEGFDPQKGTGDIEIWIPVEAKNK